ncbi:hypothetical protein [Halosegnis marinus]|uniref:Uncharacterized protein n=1 Tax=Halosegnis marinus TaxID=3034023 RepID=A0ABD5ZSY2_9EURY|nr:hypothetical protein [Halosegnis sp. DT85]
MVDPVSNEERASFALKVKLAATALVAVSAGLIAVQAGATLPVLAGALAGGAVVGAALVWFVFPGDGGTSRESAKREGRFGR